MPRGYSEVNPLNQQGSTYLNDLFSQISQFLPQAAEGYKDFLPGGSGNNAITDQANKNFQQQTLPQILSAFGSDVGFGDSSLNQALSQGASDLNTNLASLMSQNQLTAAQGLGNLGISGGQMGLQNSARSFLQKQPSFIQQLILSLMQGGSQAVSGALSNPSLFL